MALNGLDADAVNEALQSTLAEPGGWFLLHYISRDEVEILQRGPGGLPEIKDAIALYTQKSPLYGLLHWRRKKVLLKYVPEGTSRLLQARLAVHLQSVVEKFPHETVFALKDAAELSETTLSSDVSSLRASGSIKSSHSSQSRRLTEISEDDGGEGGLRVRSLSPRLSSTPPEPTVEEEKEETHDRPAADDDRTPPASSESREPTVFSAFQTSASERPTLDGLHDQTPPPTISPRDINSESPSTIARDIDTPSQSTIARGIDTSSQSTIARNIDAPSQSATASRDIDDRSTPSTFVARDTAIATKDTNGTRNSISRPSVDERPQTSSGVELVRDPYTGFLTRPKVRHGPRPVTDQRKSQTSTTATKSSDRGSIATLPAGLKMPSRSALPKSQTSITPTPTRPQTQHSNSRPPFDVDHSNFPLLTNNFAVVPAPLSERPASRGGSITSGHTFTTQFADSKPSELSAEKQRLMKALQLRRKQQQARKAAEGVPIPPIPTTTPPIPERSVARLGHKDEMAAPSSATYIPAAAVATSASIEDDRLSDPLRTPTKASAPTWEDQASTTPQDPSTPPKQIRSPSFDTATPQQQDQSQNQLNQVSPIQSKSLHSPKASTQGSMSILPQQDPAASNLPSSPKSNAASPKRPVTQQEMQEALIRAYSISKPTTAIAEEEHPEALASSTLSGPPDLCYETFETSPYVPSSTAAKVPYANQFPVTENGNVYSPETMHSLRAMEAESTTAPMQLLKDFLADPALASTRSLAASADQKVNSHHAPLDAHAGSTVSRSPLPPLHDIPATASTLSSSNIPENNRSVSEQTTLRHGDGNGAVKEPGGDFYTNQPSEEPQAPSTSAPEAATSEERGAATLDVDQSSGIRRVSEQTLQSDESFLEELDTAQVEEAKSVYVGTPGLTDQTQAISPITITRRKSSDPLRLTQTVSSPLSESTQGLRTPTLSTEQLYNSSTPTQSRPPLPQLTTAIRSSSNPFLRTPTEPNYQSPIDSELGRRSTSANLAQSMEPPGPLSKKLGMSSLISQRIKALEMYTTSTGQQSNAQSSTSIIAPDFVNKRKGSLTTPPATANSERAPSRGSPSPHGNLFMRKFGTRNVEKQNAIIQPVMPSYKPESISVTATIRRGKNNSGPDRAINESAELNPQQSPLVVSHQQSSSFFSRKGHAKKGSTGSIPELRPETARRRSDTQNSKRSARESSDTTRPLSQQSSNLSSEGGGDKKDSKRSRLIKRMSNLSFSPRKSASSKASPQMAETIEEGQEPGPAVNTAITIGEMNVQFPDTLLWKRRFVTIDSKGYLTLSPSKSDTYSRTRPKRFHISDFQTPYLPERDREELPNSVMLDFKDHSTLQFSCEHSRNQGEVLQALSKAHSSFPEPRKA